MYTFDALWELWLVLSQTLPTPKMCSSLKFSGWGKKKQISLAASYTVREACCLLTWSHFPLWKKKNHRPKRDHLALNFALLEEDKIWVKWNCCFLPSSVHQISDIFAPEVSWIFSTGLWDFYKVPLICVSLLNLGGDGRKLLFFHFDYVSSITHGFKFSLHPLKSFSNNKY